MNSSSSNCGIDDLPFEILFTILTGQRPSYAQFPRIVDKPNEQIKINVAFLRSTKFYSELRRVCSSWCHIITPYAFQEGLISTEPTTLPEKIMQFYDTYASHMHTLIISGSPFWDRQQYHSVGQAVGKGLNRCTRLKTLYCNENFPAFLQKNWIPKFAPNLATVTSLVMDARRSERELSNALVGLGRSLCRLEIIGWDYRAYLLTSEFHLPSKFPNLRHLALKSSLRSIDEHPDPDNVKKLFQRVAIESPLESLHLSLRWKRPEHVLNLLSIRNLGSKLTTLHIWFNELNRVETNDTWIEIARLCCNLIDFACLSPPFPKAALNHLPPSIQTLELPIDCLSVTTSDLVESLRSAQFPKLRQLRLRTPNDSIDPSHVHFFSALGIEALVVPP